MRCIERGVRDLLFSVLVLVSCQKKNPIGNSEDNTLHESPEIFITYDEIFQNVGQGGPDWVQDFDMDSSNLFVHPIAAFGLYQYNFSSKELRKLQGYSAGNYVAHDFIYVFWEVGSNLVFRFHLEKDSTDLQVNLAGLDYTNIDGMDIYQGVLYVHMLSQDSGNKFLAKFDLDGNFIEPIAYPRHTVHMAINNDLVYSIYYPNGTKARLSRFSLITKSFLDDKSLPTENWDGIRILEDKFYFTDFKERYIGAIQISELEG